MQQPDVCQVMKNEHSRRVEASAKGATSPRGWSWNWDELLLPALLHPQGSFLILTPMSKTQRASEMACTKASGSLQPLPTWKLEW